MSRSRTPIGLKIALAIVAVALVVVAVFLVSEHLFHKTSVIAPRDYTKKVATGGAIESKYLSMGNFKTRSLSVAAPGLLALAQTLAGGFVDDLSYEQDLDTVLTFGGEKPGDAVPLSLFEKIGKLLREFLFRLFHKQ